jgi:adenosylcobinamide-GDP ribazoletransferase
MKRLKAALQFITILPVGKSADFRPDQMIPLFPVVGLIIGALLALVDSFLTRIWPNPVVAVLDVVFLIVITGAFHIDGLGDTADGLFSHRSRERAMEIMKDSRLGTMGLVTIACVLAIKGSSLAVIEHQRFIALMVIPAYARAGILFGIRYLPYGRPDGGTGAAFFSSPPGPSSFVWLLLPVLLSLLLGVRCLIIYVVFGATITGVLLFYRRQLNCITGDMLGALVEITEAVLLLAMAAGNGF